MGVTSHLAVASAYSGDWERSFLRRSKLIIKTVSRSRRQEQTAECRMQETRSRR